MEDWIFCGFGWRHGGGLLTHFSAVGRLAGGGGGAAGMVRAREGRAIGVEMYQLLEGMADGRAKCMLCKI